MNLLAADGNSFRLDIRVISFRLLSGIWERVVMTTRGIKQFITLHALTLVQLTARAKCSTFGGVWRERAMVGGAYVFVTASRK